MNNIKTTFNLISISLLMLCMSCTAARSQTSTESQENESIECGTVSSTINVKKLDNDIVLFNGELFNSGNTIRTFTYKLVVAKQGKSGTSKTNQGGEVTVKPKESVMLSSSQVNVNRKDNCTVTLMLYENEILICENKLELN